MNPLSSTNMNTANNMNNKTIVPEQNIVRGVPLNNNETKKDK